MNSAEMTWPKLHEQLLAFAFLLGPFEADGWPCCLACHSSWRWSECKVKGSLVEMKENGLLSLALGFTSDFAVYSTWYRGLPFPHGERSGKWTSVSPLGTGAALSPGVYLPGAAVPDLLLLVASALRADIADLKPSTSLILTCVKHGEQGGQRSSAGLAD